MSFLDSLMFWKKSSEPKEEMVNDYFKPDDIVIEEYEIDIPDIEYVVDNRDKNAPVILIMDDFKGMAYLIKDELERITCCNVYNKFTVILATGEYAGFTVERAIEDGLIIDIAFLDITLGGVINGLEYDGVDVAIMIKNSNSNAEVRFVTGHTLNRKNPEIFQFITRFENYFKIPIDEQQTVVGTDGAEEIYKHIIQKNSNRVFLLGVAIQEWIKNNNLA